MKTIQGRRFPEERALYHLTDALVRNCSFEGEEDGESALKEGRDIAVEDCIFSLRYPLWHVKNLSVKDSILAESARAPVWYTERAHFENTSFSCVKPFRECSEISLKDCKVRSEEAFWRCKDVEIEHCELSSDYLLFECENVHLKGVMGEGKYGFQYTRNVTVEDSELVTKDMLWHAKDAVVKNCVIRGEYLCWYAENVTFEHCEIYGTQPFCYCKGLKLIGCTLHDCDRAFEYSDVQADLSGRVESVKNPLSGRIVADEFGELILRDAVYPCRAEIVARK